MASRNHWCLARRLSLPIAVAAFCCQGETERYPQRITTNADDSTDGGIELAPFGVRVVSQSRLRM
jgi:hypothetical protein